MCGICGTIGLDSKVNSEAVVRRMLAAIVHRGPDEEGILIAPPVVAGSRRLSIIDLPGGSQPIWNETGTLAVIYNGEIYNFRELRKELEDEGPHLRTSSDTEVIVHAYEQWGEQSVAKLRGMFALAIIEMPQGRGGPASAVFLARDPLGIKPLYYAVGGGGLLFASEVRALLASGCISPQLSAAAVPSYLLFGSVSEPMTMVEGVLSLPPGHFVKIHAHDPRRTPEPKLYWNFTKEFYQDEETETGTAYQEDFASVATTVRTLLEDSVRSHLVADVPVGVFLSGGVDSTAIAALASHVQKGIHTFTVAFPDAEFSEAEIARKTAQRLGTEHSEMTLSSGEMEARLDEAVASFDQPSMDGINTYFVSWAARQAGLKVALSGLGSDELFGGYTSFRATAQVTRLTTMARFFPKLARELATSGIKRSKVYRGSPDAFRKAFSAWLDPDLLPSPYFFTRALFTPQTVVSRLGDDSAQMGRDALVPLAYPSHAPIASHGPLHAHFLARAAFLPRQHAAARHRRHEHASFSRSARPLPRWPARRICLGTSRSPEAQSRAAESLARRCPERFVARRNRQTAQADVHFSLGNLAARQIG